MEPTETALSGGVPGSMTVEGVSSLLEGGGGMGMWGTGRKTVVEDWELLYY